MIVLNETHDPNLKSWVPSANIPGSDFPIQNLPFGVFENKNNAYPRGCIAIGDQVVALNDCLAKELTDWQSPESSGSRCRVRIKPLDGSGA